MKQSDGRGHLPLLISAEMKNMNGGYGNGGVSMLSRSYHSETSNTTTSANSNRGSLGLGGGLRQGGDSIENNLA